MDDMEGVSAKERLLNALSTYKDESKPKVNREFIARKTEYRGIVFDSKSEAVFARVLDVAGYKWEYQPRPVCGHPWDFFVANLRGKGTYIEYKPSPPTDTYISNLTDMMRPDPRESLLVWGNPWMDFVDSRTPDGFCYVTYPIFASDGKYGWGDFIQAADNGEELPMSFRHIFSQIFTEVAEYMILEAKQYRFDLR